MGNASAKDPDFWSVPDDPGHGCHNSDWMARIPDHRNLSELSIPGSNETMSYSSKHGNMWVWQQCWTLPIQMNMGIRYFDIKCRHEYDSLAMHHGKHFMGSHFDSILTEIDDYLEAHPRETFIISLKEEFTGVGNTETFESTVDKHLKKLPSERVVKSNYIPTMGEARGKIILFPRYEIQNKEKAYLKWDQCCVHDKPSGKTEDQMNKILSHLNSTHDGEKLDMFFTFCYCSHAVYTPKQVAKCTHAKLHTYVRNSTGRLGIVVMDFPGPKIIRDIVYHN